jgi:hypothetical protein
VVSSLHSHFIQMAVLINIPKKLLRFIVLQDFSALNSCLKFTTFIIINYLKVTGISVYKVLRYLENRLFSPWSVFMFFC